MGILADKIKILICLLFADQPYKISQPQIYGIPKDADEYEIKYNFTSNPLPEMRWYIENVEVPVPGENGRYSASIKVNLNNTVAYHRARCVKKQK